VPKLRVSFMKLTPLRLWTVSEWMWVKDVPRWSKGGEWDRF